MKNSLLILPLLALAGCSTTSMLTPAQVTQTVAASTSLGLAVYPQAAPDVVVARDIICSEVGTTNTAPSTLVQDLAAAGITNTTSKVIINGALVVYDAVFSLVGPASAQPYVAALCAGLTQALPTPTNQKTKKEMAHLP